MIIHTVKKGETLYSIARVYGSDPKRIAFDNNVYDELSLPVGMALAITEPLTVHTVKEGETVFSVSEIYGVTVNEIYGNNLFLNGTSDISPGERLYISIKRNPFGSYIVGGYVYPFVGKTLLDRTLPLIGTLIPFTYGFKSNGELVYPDDEELIYKARIYGVQTAMHLSTLTEEGNFSSASAEKLFGESEVQRILLDNVISNMQAKGYTALDVDFEFLGRENAAAYAEFIAYCKSRISPYGYTLIVALAPKTSDNQSGALYEGHDYALLGAEADYLLLMTYEWGYTYGPPMAISPIKPVGDVVDYALTRIPGEKLLLGISNYGYDFTLPYVEGVSKARSISAKEAYALASIERAEIFFDESAKAPYFDYSAESTEHRVWFEDIRSISSRLTLMAEKGLKGALWWTFGRENNQNLIAINQLVTPLNTQNADVFPNSATYF